MDRILLVDDEEDLLEILSDSLKGIRAEVHTCSDPREAVARLSKDQYRVIVTDLAMPEITGLQLIPYIRASDLNRNAKVFVLSGMLDNAMIERLMRLGVLECIDKLNYGSIVDKVRDALVPRVRVPVAYNPDLVRLVHGAALQTMRFYVGPELAAARSRLVKGCAEVEAIGAHIPLFGRRLFGSLALHFSSAFTDHFTRALFGDDAGDGQAVVDSELVGELCNQIAGRLKTELERHHTVINIGLPTPLPQGCPVTHLVSGRVIALPLVLGEAEATLELCLGNHLPSDGVTESDAFPVFVVEEVA